ACLLCHRAEADPISCGEKLENYGICAHEYCMVSCPLWDKEEPLRLPLMGLLCSFQVCFICSQSGATITCHKTGCDQSFHLPCAKPTGCVTQYIAFY
ncbi:PHF7 protein, partial [Xiphorhynchus elegans]|nr:PHF7 protein [Xiphorhynchus elegans]